MASMIKSTLLFLALTSIATAQIYGTSDAPFDCKSTKSFYSCMATATAWLSCDHNSDACYCADYDTEEKCLSKYCPDTTETYDNDVFSECKTIASGTNSATDSATKPSGADATATPATTGSSSTEATKTAGTGSSVAGTSQTAKPNAANPATAPIGGALGLVGIALGAFL